MYRQFNIRQFYFLSTQSISVSYGSLNKQQLFPNTALTKSFLGALAKLPKANTDFIMSVCPSVHMEQVGYHWTAFCEILCLSILRKSIKELK